MVNRNLEKGSRFESQIRDHLRDQGFETYRPRAGSARDDGDLVGISVGGRPLMLDCKNHARLELAAWLDSIRAKATRDDAFAGVIVHKRRGVGNPGEQYVTLALTDLLAILRAEPVGGYIALPPARKADQ